MRLYDLTAELLNFEEELQENYGEITEDMQERYDELLTLTRDKMENYIKLIRNMEAERDAIKVEADRLSTRAKTKDNSIKSLKELLRYSMDALDMGKVNTTVGSISVRQAPKVKTHIREDAIVPARFMRAKYEPDLKAIAEALEAGDAEAEEIAYFGEPTRYVTIR